MKCQCASPLPTQSARVCLTCGGTLSRAFKKALVAAYDRGLSLQDAIAEAVKYTSSQESK